MYLKRMELFGFKSFAEKTELDLSPGIAAVIGPNGCGKSNIVDAVRWALGEQSVKSLRGTRMEEVIFSGSENRKALNFAEVSLSFAGASSFLNLDYDEITITRRLFRNGDSEYYINKSPCRLKDVTELFLDTGLGKDVYSVIGQGRVDEIISNRPEERREIFEEAAGIFKYKLRKREARRRLDETKENLVRVQDLIYELETQVEPLQAQAVVTRRYRDLSALIAGEEKKLLSYKLKQCREELEKVNQQLQTVEDTLVSAAAEGGLHEEEVQDLKNRLHDARNNKHSYEQRLNEVSRNLEHRESDLKLLKEREERIGEQVEQNRQRVEQLALLLKEQFAQKTRIEEDLREKTGFLAQLEQELAALQEEMTGLEASSLASEVEEQQKKIYLAGVRREAAASTVEELKKRRERLVAQKTALLAEKANLEEKTAQTRETADALLRKNEALEEELSAAETMVAAKTAKVEDARRGVRKKSAEEQRKREELQGVSGRLNLLREQDAALSGYYRGVKEIMQARAQLPGIVGPLADLITVDEDHIQAFEAALGGGLQYLVAESEEAVKGAISYLKEKNRGWATFLPLDILHRAADPLERYPGWRDLAGVIGKASELVEANPAYRKAVDYMTANILVCRNLEDASKAARFIKHSCRVVTLDGELINPGGVIRGGSVPKRNAGMPLGRRREIEALEMEKAAMQEQLDRIAVAGKEAVKLLAEAEQDLEKSLEERQNVSARLDALHKEWEKAMRELEALSHRLETGEAACRELEEEEKEIAKRLETLQEEISSCSEEITLLERELAGARETYRQYLEEKKELEQRITGVLVKTSSYREQRDTLKERLKEIEENLGKPAEETEEMELQHAKLMKDLQNNRQEREEIIAQVRSLTEDKAAMITEVEGTAGLVTGLEAQLIELEEKERLRRGRVNRQEKRERQLSVEQTRLETEINYQQIRFRELFGNLDLVDLESEYDHEESTRIIENLKEDLEALGEVNLGAIEELARLEDRINFLKEQRDDLHQGEASLQKVLAEIDQRMEYYFKDAFAIISENFQQTYQELFQGGQVMLKLTDADHILDSGIEIVAQPPGKKLQNITLLSAGEKVLTAIALVFAILRFKPAPFYLLDEVESTLDDANLTRFTKFLKKTAAQAQFILITHRKRTMEEAEVLYGVTMPEPGVSRLMSLKLEDDVISRES